MKDGYGTWYLLSGEKVMGIFKEGKLHGSGVFCTLSG